MVELKDYHQFNVIGFLSGFEGKQANLSHQTLRTWSAGPEL
jgi:hypothetical protein